MADTDDLIQRMSDMQWAGNNRALVNEARDRLAELEAEAKENAADYESMLTSIKSLERIVAERDAEIALRSHPLGCGTAQMIAPRKGILPCEKCGGDGREWRSRYGGNDPDVWDAGPCEACDGTGEQTCEDCGDNPAMFVQQGDDRRYYLCASCQKEWDEGG